MIKRFAVLVALAAAVVAAVLIPFSANPEVPVIKHIFDPHGQRLVIRVIVFGAAFVVAMYAVTMAVQGLVLGQLPSKMGIGPFSTEWTPADAKALREVDERLQVRITEAIDLANDAIKKIKELENG